MKRTLTLIIGLFGVVAASAFVMSDNGIAGRTGSTGETTCNTSGCHTGNALNAAGGSITIAAPTLTNWQYVPGTVYPISVTVARSGCPIFGIGFEALRSTGANGGTLAAGSGTTIKNASISGNTRTNIVHTLNGGATANSKTFTFNWTAPAAGTGNVTFYAAGNATNGSGNVAGDFIYTTSQIVTEFTSGISENNIMSTSLKVLPNPVQDRIHFTFTTGETQKMDIRLTDLNGKTAAILFRDEMAAGSHDLTYPINVRSGLYLLDIRSTTGNATKKVIVL